MALILNPQVTVLEFLQAICRELDVPLPDERDRAMALVDALNRYLLDAHARGRRIILLVDEAQNLSEDVLEQLRLLTNLETARQKLLQIILIGQPELREILARNNLRQLAQRVTGRYHLEPLSREESGTYIDHRMRVAGGLGETFDAGAKREIYRLSGGIPRLMNVICDRALLGAYSQESRVVDRRLVRSAASEVSGQTRRVPWRTGALVIAGFATFAIAASVLMRLPGGDLPPTEPDIESPAASEETVALLAIEPAAESLRDNTVADSATDTIEPPGDQHPTLAERLESGELSTSVNDAMSIVLERWGVDYDATAGTGCSRARAAGLSCLWAARLLQSPAPARSPCGAHAHRRVRGYLPVGADLPGGQHGRARVRQ